jgi:hypothetical protein
VISNCYTTGTVSSTGSSVGGLVGEIGSGGNVVDCYAIATVSSSSSGNIGGLAGYNYGTVSYCYAAATVTATGGSIGGLLGNSGTVATVSYYNSDLCSTGSSFATAKTTSQLTTQSTFTDAGWDFTNIWAISSGTNSGYPYILSSSIIPIVAVAPTGSPLQVATINNLYWISQNSSSWGSSFIQTADIDASSTKLLDNGSGFTPIGSESTNFTGTYNGNGHVISHLYINRSSTSYVGLFGFLYGTFNIHNLGIINASITGYNYVGGIAGYTQSKLTTDSITRCFVSGNISGRCYVGGIIGMSANLYYSHIRYCYSSANITASYYAGGIAGLSSSFVKYCYNTGKINCSYESGGLFGGQSGIGTLNYGYSTGVVTAGSSSGALVGLLDGTEEGAYYLYWNTETSGQSNAIGSNTNGVSTLTYGLTTSQMRHLSNMSNINIDRTSFGIIDGKTYPALLDVSNNAPFAFPDTVTTTTGRITISTSVLANDYDYETAQTKLVERVISCSNTYGSITGNVYTFHSGTTSGTTETITYQVGEALDGGDTLWGNQTTAMFVASGTVPVELTSFTATSSTNSATLAWKTATETNNYGFNIERRLVGKTVNGKWEKVGFVAGNGTSSSAHSYSYTDASVASGTYAYRLKQIDNSGTYKYSSEAEVTINVPTCYALGQNYPNPFNPATVISYQLPVSGSVSLKVYDVIGREVATLVNETKEAGSYQVIFNASKLASGVYFYKLTAGSYASVKKLMLLK